MTDTTFPEWDRKEPYADWRKRSAAYHEAQIRAVKASLTEEEQEAAKRRASEVVSEMLAEWEEIRKG